MLLQALYDFSKTVRGRHGLTLFESPQFESRYVSWLIDLDASGTFRGWVLLVHGDEPGLLFDKLPRTLEPKDRGTIAEFLVEDVTTVLGIGESPTKRPKDKARQKHEHFWSRLLAAADDLKHSGLLAALNWKANCLDTGHAPQLSFESYQKAGSRAAAKEQWLVKMGSGEKAPLYFRPNASIDVTFKVGGQVLVHDDAILEWWSRWADNWIRQREDACREAHAGGRLCVVCGEPDAPVSNSHLPKIRGRVIQSFGATLASAEADSYQSYGLAEQNAAIPGARKGPDASYANVSVRAAIAYCTALNYLLEHEDHHINLGPLSVCFWAKVVPQAARQFNLLLSKAYPDQVREFLRGPFAGVEREVLKRDRLYTIALSGNAGRVVVQHWIDQTLDDAIRHFAQWWSDLDIVPLFVPAADAPHKRVKKAQAVESAPSPLAIPNLARVSLRRSKDQKDEKLVSERIVQIYRAALEGTAPPIMLLKPILDEFESALLKNDPKNPALKLSRFAFIKLLLIRTRKEDDFMPTPELADTCDPAYNCGRLLAVLQALQNRSRVAGKDRKDPKKADRPGAGVIERYYGRASTGPATVFPTLLHLSRHHLAKLQQGNERDKKAAAAFERRKAEILARLKPDPNKPGSAPQFQRLFSLAQQGSFALGFYQQKAYDREQLLQFLATQGREGDDLATDDDEEVGQDG